MQPSPPLNYFQAALTRVGKSRDYRDAAAAGYWSAILAAARTALPLSLRESFSSELEWMAGRSFRLPNGNMAPFFSDAPALLGLALGAQHGANEAAKEKIGQWLNGMLAECRQRRGINEWELCFLAATHHICGGDDKQNKLPQSPQAAASCIALRHCKALPCAAGQSLEGEESVLRWLQSAELKEVRDTQATILAASYDWIIRATPSISIERATVAEVVKVLKGIQASLHRWTWEDKAKTPNSQARQWHIDHEYHVQNLLWIVLKPLFADLVDEFYPSLLAKRGRVPTSVSHLCDSSSKLSSCVPLQLQGK